MVVRHHFLNAKRDLNGCLLLDFFVRDRITINRSELGGVHVTLVKDLLVVLITLGGDTGSDELGAEDGIEVFEFGVLGLGIVNGLDVVVHD